MSQLSRQQAQLPAMMRLVRHEVAEKMHQVSREILPRGRRNRTATRHAQPDQLNHTFAAAFERAR